MTPCVLWDRGVGSHGYGARYVDGRQVLAHRYALEQALGRPLQPGMEALHACDVKLCVNPDHLREGTHAENMAEAAARGLSRAGRSKADACPQGHAMDDANVLVKPRPGRHGRTYITRSCRECNRLYLARRRAAKRVSAT